MNNFELKILKKCLKSKFGVDMAHQMARKYNTINILNLAGILVWILYKETTKENISKQNFLLYLVGKLAANYREAREKQMLITNTEITSINFTTNYNKHKMCQIRCFKDNKNTNLF